MKLKKALTLSIVIPVYNEEHHILDCLLAIQRQTVLPYEVIVVDNNCTDDTIQIAKQFSFVKIVKQPKQGRGWARTAGFNTATGDIIGRIDADSKIDSDWVERALYLFTNDKTLMGVTGLGRTVLLPRVMFLRGTFWSRAYYWFVDATFRTLSMWGATMALRRTAWLQVASDVCNDDQIVHEDQDVSLCMAAKGLRIQQDNKLLITTSGQTYNYFPKLLQYYRLERSTHARHKKLGTFDSKKLHKLSFWQVLPGRIYAVLPGLFIVTTSLLFWPLDHIMILLGKEKSWLD